LDELGPLSNSAFGTAATTTHVDPAISDGWNVRPINWETSVGIQHEWARQVSVSVAYFHRSYGNFTVLDNRSLIPADYNPYCMTPPADAKMPGVGGGQICGLYDLNPSKVSVVPNNLVTGAAQFGKQTETVMANYQVTNAVVQGLGRNLTATPTVPLIYPGRVFGDRIYQLDLRLTKGIQFGTLRARLILDIANALNGNTVLVQNSTYGVNWLQPTYILPGRLIKPTIEIKF
jgi:hypothetical protein